MKYCAKINNFNLDVLDLFLVFIGILILGNVIINSQPIYLIAFIVILAFIAFNTNSWQKYVLIFLIWLVYCLLLVFLKIELSIKQLNNFINQINPNFYSLRNKAINYLNSIYSNSTSQYINLLLFNNKGNNPVYELTKQLSITHLIVVSGLHINVLLFIFNKMIFLKVKNHYYQSVFQVIFCFIYSYFLAYSISILRITINSIIKLFFNKCDSKKINCYSGMIILLFLKNEVTSYGFLMSYLCSIGICILAFYIRNKLTLTIVINGFCILITLPFVIKMNGKINIFSFFYNYMFACLIIFDYLWFLIFAWFKPFIGINNYLTKSMIDLMHINLDLAVFIVAKPWKTIITAVYYTTFLFIFSSYTNYKMNNFVYKNVF